MSMDVETDATEQSLEKDRLKAAQRTRAAMTVVAVILLSIVSCCAYSIAAQWTARALVAVYAMAVIGIVLFLSEPKSDSQELNEFRILRFYSSKRFYGVVVAVTSGLVMVFAFVTAEPAHAKARPMPVAVIPPPDSPPAEVAATPEVTPPEFPHLKVTGMILNGLQSSALINGKTIRLGESIEQVRLVEIREEYVEVELKGFRRYVPRADLVAEPAPRAPAPRTQGTRR